MDIAENIETIKKNLPKGVKLVAVSKNKPNEDILEAYQSADTKYFGENTRFRNLVGKVRRTAQRYRVAFYRAPANQQGKVILHRLCI
jgi:uncharacterized pyridoxal phosphate-containing UPF0001 family protein